ncbi:MAG: 1-acyl-sn-glycerol-3-phosphate acyltransferase [Chloroflexi bacterium]|nr:1-acyl-sn-glycerol-3-phosphate acyltransferase [Chloroflexota bacterium]
MAVLYNVGISVGRACFTLFSRWEVEGRESVPRKGRLIIVANHQSNMDPPLIAATMPRRVYFLGKKELFANRLFSVILDAWGVYPVGRSGHDFSALLRSVQLLEQEKALVVFPETTRNPRGMRRSAPGVAYLALKTGAPILPVGITGTEHVGPMIRVAMPLCRVKVSIGTAFTLPPVDGPPSREVLEGMTELVMRRVAALLPLEYRGIYASSVALAQGGE